MAACVLLMGLGVPHIGVGQWHQPFSSSDGNDIANDRQEQVGIGFHGNQTPPEQTLHLYGSFEQDRENPFGMRYRRTDENEMFCNSLWDVLSNINLRCEPVTRDQGPDDRVRLTTYYSPNGTEVFPIFDLQFIESQPFVGIMEPNAGSLLSVSGNLSLGRNYSPVAAPEDGAIIEGAVGIGTTDQDGAKVNVLGGYQRVRNNQGGGLYIYSNGANESTPGRLSGIATVDVNPVVGDALVVSNIANNPSNFSPAMKFYSLGQNPLIGTGGISVQVRGAGDTRGISLFVGNDSVTRFRTGAFHTGILTDMWTFSRANIGTRINCINAETNIGVDMAIGFGPDANTNPLQNAGTPIINRSYGVRAFMGGGQIESIGYSALFNNLSLTDAPGTTANIGFFVRNPDPFSVTGGYRTPPTGPGLMPGGERHNWGVWSANPIYCPALFVPSDEKLKTNITSFTPSSDLLKVIKVYKYDFDRSKTDFLDMNKEQNIGFLAQEIKKVFPSLIRNSFTPADAKDTTRLVNTSKTFKAVNQVGLIPVMWSVIQELNKRIEALESQSVKSSEVADSGGNFNTSKSNLLIYPNPNSGKFDVKYMTGSSSHGVLKCTVVRPSGEIIQSFEIAPNLSVRLDLTSKGRGAFQIIVTDDGNVKVSKLVIVE